ncbi:NADH-ubiquinone oxidoreductase-F iron-sulfur binding region domain-containing protein [Conexibacter sp. JD483]|uniref:NADH-ubiquinone oxidoreductase-F iron-sulfur binding region domain-containing protein n=1 Tax=unclassified Conexibacter TaxID=2627773 RepID=UPI00271B64F1|nr:MULTISPECIES: NADH-ubiquinone oxidoreductase-F iron-sulfur binding region domain-containing protein [unclassified Conexibacter]MDO8188411.1 NADH-ubiquinone oxidoreductase-F iron-sulfur binding region domain-containing protein [Conexibacter sp. CPCC 205706]MDO8198198.1 NADH-ubiquinone oxidoreductase-F iron-sulfur binding region domain-containing protein [Conexibacter sp. CPCC 205762]MDR9370666.1 NADH-ubiquinone oxidoreductase-F iron-sulfur binding region domain-containing protein [Conexibacter
MTASTPRLMAGPGRGTVALGDHLALHGLPALESGLGAGALADLAERAGLRGRGGAGFPTDRKLRALAEARRAPFVVANGSEGEPASGKDRTLLTRSPHLVLDGLQLTALALGAERAVVAVRAGAGSARAALATALAERTAAGRDRVPVEVFPVPAGFVAGEERAVLNALAGGPPLPTVRRPWEGARPALVQNVETLAQLALIAAHGADWFRAAGTAAEPGTTLVTLDAAVVREVPLGTPLSELMPGASDANRGASDANRGASDANRGASDANRGASDAHRGEGDANGGAGVRALLVGGYAGGWVDGAAAGRVRLLQADLRPLGATVGCGAIVALPAGSCGVAETVRLMRWLADESAGQCGPCLYGLDAIATALEPLSAPRRPREDPLPRVRRWCGQIDGRGACRHPDGALRMLASALRVFAAEFDDHVRHGACERCAAPSLLPLPAHAATPEEVAA